MFFPRFKAAHVVRHLLDRLADPNQKWTTSLDGNVVMGKSGHQFRICTKHGCVWHNNTPVWIPFFKRLRLRRAARTKALELCLKDLCDEG